MNNEPEINDKNGIVYPIIYQIFSLGKWWPPAKMGKNYKYIDSYILMNWILEIVIFISILTFSIPFFIKIIITFYILFRLIDILLILLSTIIRGTYQDNGNWSSPNRIFFFVLMNTVEIFFIFAIFYYFLGPSHFNLSNINCLNSFLDSIYFSVVTGITLGYGDIYPVTTIAKILVIIQPLITLFLLINMLTYSIGKYKQNDKS